MVVPDQSLQPLLQNMRVNLGRRNVGMTKQFLHDAQIRAIFEEVARECVTDNMRREL